MKTTAAKELALKARVARIVDCCRTGAAARVENGQNIGRPLKVILPETRQ